MDATQTIADPIAIVRQLDAERIRERIDAIDRERDALLVLLRAAKRYASRDGEEGFLNAIFPDAEDEPDREMITFMQRSLGRSLTGDVTEQILLIFWGVGANGKNTFINAIFDTIGSDYCLKANTDLLMASRGERHPTEIANLWGKRLVVASETHQGRKLNEALVKDLTGGEPLTARRMREDFWTFQPTHKVILITNHKPRVEERGEAIWRRVRLVPFTTIFWDPNDPSKDASQLPTNLRQDKQLGEKLKAEREGILAWLVRGCMDWQRDGLTLPEKVKVATQEYRIEEDTLKKWIEEDCITGDKDYRCRSQQLYLAGFATKPAICNETGLLRLSCGRHEASEDRFATKPTLGRGFLRKAPMGHRKNATKCHFRSR